MLGEMEVQGRRFRLRREPMVKVKQVGLRILALRPSGSLLVISRQLMLSTLDVSAVDVRLETPIDEAEARLVGVSQFVGHGPLSRSIPFQVPPWSVLGRQSKLHSLSKCRKYVPGRATYRRLPSLDCRLLPRAWAMMKDAENSREAGKVALSNFRIQKHLCDPPVTEYRYFQRTVAIKLAILFKSQTPSHR